MTELDYSNAMTILAFIEIGLGIWAIGFAFGRSENPVHNRLKAMRHKWARLIKNQRLVRDQAVRNSARNLQALENEIKAYSYLEEQNVKLKDELLCANRLTDVLKSQLNKEIDEKLEYKTINDFLLAEIDNLRESFKQADTLTAEKAKAIRIELTQMTEAK